MKILVIFSILIFILSMINAAQIESESQEDQDDDESSEEISDKIDKKTYSYNYEVNEIDDKLFFNKTESSDGYKVSGTFSVLRADGKLMTVEYFATKDDGFVPKISITDKLDNNDDDDKEDRADDGDNSKEEKDVKNT